MATKAPSPPRNDLPLVPRTNCPAVAVPSYLEVPPHWAEFLIQALPKAGLPARVRPLSDRKRSASGAANKLSSGGGSVVLGSAATLGGVLDSGVTEGWVAGAGEATLRSETICLWCREQTVQRWRFRRTWKCRHTGRSS